jgi:hypothetical protein
MTDPRDDQFWNEMRPEMRRALHLEPLSDEEAAREFDEAPEIPLSEEQIAEFARLAARAVPREPSYNERTTKPKAEIEKEVGEVVELYRNEGDLDPDVEEEMRRQREEALADDDEEEDDEETDES